MLIFVTGSDAYLARQAINQIKAKYLAKNDGTELVEVDCSEALPNFADLAAVPLFASSRLVILKKVGALDAAAQESLARVLTDLPTTTVAVVWDQKPLPKGGALALVGATASKKIAAEPLNEPATRRWLQARSKELGLALDASTVNDLLQSVGSDLWFLETELQYLAAAGLDHRQTSPIAPRPDDYFVYYRLVRAKAWSKIGAQLAADFRGGTPFELLLGSLAAAVRKEVTDPADKTWLTELLGDNDFAVKTGLIEPADAVALITHHLSNRGPDRLHWEAVWEGVV